MTHKIAILLLKGNIAIRNIEDIVHIQANESVCYVYLRNGEKLVSVLPLNKYTGFLENDYSFFSVNRSLLINLRYLSEFNDAEQEIKMVNEMVISISRRGAKKLKEFLANTILIQDNTTALE